jgi:hypothetical protein|tara:strand:- start:1150 stop:1482 length:333 start_codon:yes stop_codon:yes gene_type:complete
MATLFTKVKLYLDANSKTWDNTTIVLQNDGSGDYIKTWTVSGLDKPTDEQLASYETAANTVEANIAVDDTRKIQYLSWQEQMEMIYKDQKNGTTTFKDHCDKVRSDNPKG